MVSLLLPTIRPGTANVIEELEDMFIENRIPFDRYSDSYCEYQAEYRHYRPEHEGQAEIDVVVTVDNDGCPFVPTGELMKLLDMEPQQCQQALKEVIQKYDPDIPPLELWA